MILATSADASDSRVSSCHVRGQDRSEERDRQRGRVRNQVFDRILEELGGEKVSGDVQEESPHFRV